MLPDIRPGNTKILYFFNCLLDGMHTTPGNTKILYFFNCLLDGMHTKTVYICDFSRCVLDTRLTARI